MRPKLGGIILDFLLMYRSTAHATTGASPAELLFNRKTKDKLPCVRDVTAADDLWDRDYVELCKDGDERCEQSHCHPLTKEVLYRSWLSSFLHKSYNVWFHFCQLWKLQDHCGGLEAEKILITTLSRRNHQNIDRLLEAVAAQLILADWSNMLDCGPEVRYTYCWYLSSRLMWFFFFK